MINIFGINKLEISKFWKPIRTNENLFNYSVLDYLMKLMASWMDLDEFLGANNQIYWQDNGQKIQHKFVTGNHLDHISNIVIKLNIIKIPALSNFNRDNFSNNF